MQAVVGLNSGMRREGIAHRVIAELSCDPLDRTTLAEADDFALSILDALLRHHRVIIVDEVRGGSPAGSIYRLTPEQYSTFEPAESLRHELSLADVVDVARSIGATASVIVFGVEPENPWEAAPVWRDNIVRAVSAVVTAELESGVTKSMVALRAS